MRNRVGLGLFVALIFLALPACGKAPTKFSVEKFNQSSAKTEQDVVAELGPAEVVSDSYTQSVIEAHKLAPTARFLRWSDPKQPGVYYHVVIVDDKIVERDVWDSRKK